MLALILASNESVFSLKKDWNKRNVLTEGQRWSTHSAGSGQRLAWQESLESPGWSSLPDRSCVPAAGPEAAVPGTPPPARHTWPPPLRWRRGRSGTRSATNTTTLVQLETWHDMTHSWPHSSVFSPAICYTQNGQQKTTSTGEVLTSTLQCTLRYVLNNTFYILLHVLRNILTAITCKLTTITRHIQTEEHRDYYNSHRMF